ncbi:hypothetical protein EJD97_021942 [Solanum chilense]|uniref:Gag-pol polyprotein n=1 Tax=Solanum chilense TaxID=4083 RepID=A0A6N2CJ06_SOLCI|nr:hypothetical protein EJD97_021942 [Solanum chilense]
MEEDPQGFIDEVFKVLDAMGVSSQENVKLAAYQSKNADQVRYEQWMEDKPIEKVTTIVADSRDKMTKFVMGISYLVVNQCRLALLIPSIGISRLMDHSKQIEDQKLKQVGKELKRECPMVNAQGRENAQTQASCPNSDSFKKNHLYALKSRVIKRALQMLLSLCYKGMIIVGFKDLELENPPLELVPVVKDFLEVFIDDLPGIPPEQEVYFDIYIFQVTQPISMPLYRMAPPELK